MGLGSCNCYFVISSERTPLAGYSGENIVYTSFERCTELQR
jgi:hypothetical protein